MALLTPYAHIAALVIDDMSVQQTTLRGQLGMIGITKVDVAGSPDDAVRLVRSKAYGLVLCDYRLNAKSDGQQLMEYFRENALLPADCLFFMVTAESGFVSVVSASEHKPDCYLLKPITAGDIEDRLKMLLERQKALARVHACVGTKNLAGAIAECDAILARKDRWALQALQIKGQSLLQLARADEALALYSDTLAQRPALLWAKVGLARAHKAANRHEEAKAIANEILQSTEGAKNLDAYDVLAQSLEALGDTDGALWAMKDAAAAVPTARRQRVLAESAYRCGEAELAKECMAKVCATTKGSLAAQTQDTLLYAQSLVDVGEAAQALSVLTAGAAAMKNDPQLEGVGLAIRAQGLAQTGDHAGAAAAAASARRSMRQAKADFATVTLAKAELMTGNVEAGLKLMQQAMSADHENTRVQQLIRKALKDTGREDQVTQVFEAATSAMASLVAEAKKLFRDSNIDAALGVIDKAIAQYPENTAVLLQGAQMHCLSLRLKKETNAPAVEKVRTYLSRLDRLMPMNHRVTQMRHYFRDTVDALSAPQPA